MDQGREHVLRIASGYRTSKVLFAAVELGVFTALAEGPLTAEELTERLGLHPRGTRDFLHALTGMGLLEHEGDRYGNAQPCLTDGTAGSVGGFLRFLDDVLHPAWDGLTESLRTGRPYSATADDPYHRMYEDPSDRDGFLAAMDALTRAVGARIAELEWSRYKSFVDVGGARGSLAAQLLDAHPRLTATVFDLPGMRPAFDSGTGAHGQIQFHAGDFFTDPLPTADVLIFGHVLHNWPVPARIELLRKAYQALAPGGAVLIYDPLIDERNPRLAPALASLNMLVWTEGGSEYTFQECRSWLTEAGFQDAAEHPVEGSSTVVVAHKPRV
jgi:SAM-dependent methyltransferase